MEHLKTAVQEVMRNLSSQQAAFGRADPQQWLKKALTKRELGHIRVKYFRNNILGLNVDSSAWLYVLSAQKGAILAKLQKECPALKNIVLRIGEVAEAL